MEESLKSAFQKAKIEPNTKLKDKIWRNVVLGNKRTAYFKLASFSIVGIASLVGFIPMFKILINDFTQSGFYEYLSHVFSKGGLFSSYSKEFVYSLAESLPTMSIVFSLTLLLIFFLSLYFTIKQIINNNYMERPYVIA